MQTQSETQNLVVRHVQLLKSFANVAHVLRGVAAVLWLPGLKQRFDGPRRVTGTRPLAVTLEVTDSLGLTLSGAVSRPKKGKMVYDTIFKYEFTSPMQPDAKGSVLNAKNEVIARRALALLASLVRFGEKRAYQPRSAKLAQPRHPVFLVPFNPGEERYDEAKLTELASDMAPELVETYRERLRQDLTDRTTLPGTVLVNSAIVEDEVIAKALEQEAGYEDFDAVLGVPHWNPVVNLHEMPNPATAFLARNGVMDLNDLEQAQVDQLLALFREAVPLGERLTDEEIYDALCNPSSPLVCAQGFDGIPDARVAFEMRKAAGSSRAAWEATDEDLVRAARKPSEPLILSRLSATQVVAAADLTELPAPYAGSFLAPLDWEPPRRRVKVA